MIIALILVIWLPVAAFGLAFVVGSAERTESSPCHVVQSEDAVVRRFRSQLDAGRMS